MRRFGVLGLLAALMNVGACSGGGGPSAEACNADLEKLKSAEATYFAHNGRYGTLEELAALHLAASDMLHGVVMAGTGSSYTVVPVGGKCASSYVSSPAPSPN